MFQLTKVGKDELAQHFDAVCDLLEKHYGCKNCPFNIENSKVEREINFECKLDEVIEDVYKTN